MKGKVARLPDPALYRQIIQHDVGNKADARGDHTVDLNEHRRVVGQFRALRVQIQPFGKDPLFRAGELDLLHAGDKAVAHAGFLCRVLHLPAVDPDLRQRGDDGEDHRHQHDHQRRDHQRRGETEDLADVQKRGQRGESGAHDHAHQHGAELTYRLGAAFQLAGAVFPEKRCRQRQKAHHHGGLHAQRSLGVQPSLDKVLHTADQLRREGHADHADRDPDQGVCPAAGKHRSGKRPGDPRHDKSHQRHRKRRSDDDDDVAEGHTAFHVQQQIRDPQLFLRQRTVEANGFGVKESGRIRRSHFLFFRSLGS